MTYVILSGISVIAGAIIAALVVVLAKMIRGKPIRRSAVTIIGVASAIVFFAGVAGLADLQKTKEAGSKPGASPSSSTEEVEGPTENPDSAGTDDVLVEVQLSEPARVGRKIGANKFQLVDAADGPTVHVRYRWEVRSEGVSVAGDDCEILVSVSGPQDLAGLRSSECGQDYQSAFNSGGTQFAIHQAGTYNIKVQDKASGATGTVKFEVVG